MKLRRLTLPGLATFCFAVAACGADPEQARLCGLTVGAFAEGAPAALRAEPIVDGTGVRVAWVARRRARRVESRLVMTGRAAREQVRRLGKAGVSSVIPRGTGVT